jgi:hypothetical protein
MLLFGLQFFIPNQLHWVELHKRDLEIQFSKSFHKKSPG